MRPILKICTSYLAYNQIWLNKTPEKKKPIVIHYSPVQHFYLCERNKKLKGNILSQYSFF